MPVQRREPLSSKSFVGSSTYMSNQTWNRPWMHIRLQSRCVCMRMRSKRRPSANHIVVSLCISSCRTYHHNRGRNVRTSFLANSVSGIVCRNYNRIHFDDRDMIQARTPCDCRGFQTCSSRYTLGTELSRMLLGSLRQSMWLHRHTGMKQVLQKVPTVCIHEPFFTVHKHTRSINRFVKLCTVSEVGRHKKKKEQG